MNNKETAMKIAEVLDNKKGQEIVILDIAEKSGFADYFVIVTGMSERQVGTLSDEARDEMEKQGVFPKAVEGRAESGWVLIDFGDVIVNVFLAEKREKYNLEKVWADCERIEFSGE